MTTTFAIHTRSIPSQGSYYKLSFGSLPPGGTIKLGAGLATVCHNIGSVTRPCCWRSRRSAKAAIRNSTGTTPDWSVHTRSLRSAFASSKKLLHVYVCGPFQTLGWEHRGTT